jgi:hypothetical protein
MREPSTDNTLIVILECNFDPSLNQLVSQLVIGEQRVQGFGEQRSVIALYNIRPTPALGIIYNPRDR